MTKTRAIGALLLGALLVVMAGCGGRGAPFRFYLLSAVAGPVPAAPEARPASVAIGPVTLPAYLDRPQIVTRQGRDEIDLAETDRWGEPLVDGVPRTIADNLAALMPAERIALFPWAGPGAMRSQVVVDVTRFDGALGQDVVLEARWRVVGADVKDAGERRFVVREPTGAATYPALVAAMSRALGALSREMAAALRAA